MTSRTDCDRKTAKELFLEQAAAYFNHAEAFCVKQGRELIRIPLLFNTPRHNVKWAI